MVAKRIPRYRHHKTTGRAIVRLDGRDVYIGRFGSPESRQRYARIIADLAAGRPVLPDDGPSVGATVGMLVDAFQRHAETAYAASNEADRYVTVQRLLLELDASTPAAAFGPRNLKRLRERLVASGHARSSVNRNIVRLRTMFRWGVAEGLVPVEVASALAMVRGLRAGEAGVREAPPVRPVPRETVEATLGHLAPPLAAMVRLQLLTGMRPGEACAMRPVDIDTTGPVWWYTPPSHKTAHRGKVRRIPLIAAAQEIVRPFLVRALDAPCFSPAEALAWCRERRHAERTTPLSCGNRPGTNRRQQPAKGPGDRYDSRSYAQAIGYAVERAFPDSPSDRHWAPNQLRHLVATEVRRRFGLEAARIVCGHSTASTTETYYAEVNAAQAAEYLEMLA